MHLEVGLRIFVQIKIFRNKQRIRSEDSLLFSTGKDFMSDMEWNSDQETENVCEVQPKEQKVQESSYIQKVSSGIEAKEGTLNDGKQITNDTNQEKINSKNFHQSQKQSKVEQASNAPDEFKQSQQKQEQKNQSKEELDKQQEKQEVIIPKDTQKESEQEISLDQLDASWTIDEKKKEPKRIDIEKDEPALTVGWEDDQSEVSMIQKQESAFKKKQNHFGKNQFSAQGTGGFIKRQDNQGTNNFGQGGRGKSFNSNFNNSQKNDWGSNQGFGHKNQGTGFGRGGGQKFRDFQNQSRQDNYGGGGRGRGGRGGRGGRNYSDSDQNSSWKFGGGRGRDRDEDGGSFGRGGRGGGGFGRGGRGGRESDQFNYNKSRNFDNTESRGFDRGNSYSQRNQFNNTKSEYTRQRNYQFEDKKQVFSTQPETKTQPILPILEQEKTINFNEMSMIQSQPTSNNNILKTNQDFRINKTMACKPIGLKCWPSVSLYIRQTKVSIFMSRIIDHKCTILFFPYKEYNLRMYPGNIINQSPFDYKKKLKQKDQPAGFVYFQKSIKINPFQALAFTKLKEDGSSDTQKIMEELVVKGSTLVIPNSKVQSILIPYSKQLGSMKKLFNGILKGLEQCPQYNQIVITTNEPADFIVASQQFLEEIQKLAENNEIVIQ